MSLLDFLTHIALTIALIPGSLIFLGVCAWRIARAVAGFRPPSLPLRSTDGSIVYTEADWRKDAKDEFPIRYALFEGLPRGLRKIGRRVSRALHLRTSKEAILFKAFGVFADWVDANKDFVYGSIFMLEDDGPDQQQLVLKSEMRALYRWWTKGRPADLARIDDADDGTRAHLLLDFEMDDQVHLARLANIWRNIS